MGNKTGIAVAVAIVCGGGARVRADPGDLTNAWARWHLELDGGVASTSGVAGGRPSQGRALALGVGVRHDRHTLELAYALGSGELDGDGGGAVVDGVSQQVTARWREALEVVLGRLEDPKRGAVWIELGGGAAWEPWQTRARPVASLGVGADLASDHYGDYDDHDDPYGPRYTGLRVGVAVTASPRGAPSAQCLATAGCAMPSAGGVDLAVVVTAAIFVGR
jgi:hypothetical protein